LGDQDGLFSMSERHDQSHEKSPPALKALVRCASFVAQIQNAVVTDWPLHHPSEKQVTNLMGSL
jgi:hypothetical protein